MSAARLAVMNSAVDERVLAMYRMAIWAEVCSHLRDGEDGHACFRCYRSPEPLLCDVCIAEHRHRHEDGRCDLCSEPIGDAWGDIADVFADVNGDTSITTGTLNPSPSLDRLVLARVHVVGRVCERCYVGVHVEAHLDDE